MHRNLKVIPLFLLSLVMLGCGAENVSHPDIQGEWALVQMGRQRVPEQDSFVLRITDRSFELRRLNSGAAVWGGVRSYRWDKGKIVIEPTEGFEASAASIVSTSKQRLELAEFFDWDRAAFRRITPEEWQKVAPSPSWDEEFLKHLEGRLQGVWEKGQGRLPFAELALLVEIGNGQIRGQAFTPAFLGYRRDLLGKEEPCTYKLESPKEAKIYCPNNKKTYPMELSFASENQLRVKLLGFDFELYRSDEKRFRFFTKKYKIQFHRLDGGKSAVVQTNAVGNSPNP